MAQELRDLEHQQAELHSRIAAAGTPEPLPDLHRKRSPAALLSLKG